MIRTYAISRHYGNFEAVKDVSICIQRNEIFGFLGLNGAGKTTFLRMVCGLLRPSSGYASMGDVEIHGLQNAGKLIPMLSFVSQDMRLYESATLGELLPIYAGLAGSTAEEGIRFAKQVGLPLNRPCSKFSPGQQRKAQLAIALMKDPQYLVLDEPSAGLDPKGVAEIREIIRSMHGEGKTIVLSSHILGEVQAICTSVGILHNGQMHYQGPLKRHFTIEILQGKQKAMELLKTMGIAHNPVENGLQVEMAQEEISAIRDRFIVEDVSVGFIEEVQLESIFNKVVMESEVGA